VAVIPGCALPTSDVSITLIKNWMELLGQFFLGCWRSASRALHKGQESFQLTDRKQSTNIIYCII